MQYIDGAGVVTNYKVNASGRVEEEAVTMEDGTVAATKYTYDSYGNITSKTDAKNNTTQYVYDEEDRLSKEIRPDGTYYWLVAYYVNPNNYNDYRMLGYDFMIDTIGMNWKLIDEELDEIYRETWNY